MTHTGRSQHLLGEDTHEGKILDSHTRKNSSPIRNTFHRWNAKTNPRLLRPCLTEALHVGRQFYNAFYFGIFNPRRRVTAKYAHKQSEKIDARYARERRC